MGKAWKNLFAQERAKYQPTLPQIFTQIDGIEAVVGQITPAPDAVKSHFPKTGTLPLIHMTAHEKKSYPPLRVGVGSSGGQAAGGHNVIIGLFDALKKLHPGCRLFGFRGGPLELLKIGTLSWNKSSLIIIAIQGDLI